MAGLIKSVSEYLVGASSKASNPNFSASSIRSRRIYNTVLSAYCVKMDSLKDISTLPPLEKKMFKCMDVSPCATSPAVQQGFYYMKITIFGVCSKLKDK